LIHALNHSKSQLRQDVLAASLSAFAYEGYFVEIGACDGISFSNTFMLEKKFNWQGLVVEPAKVWQKELYKNRTCAIESRAVGNLSNEKIQFHETSDPMLSTYEHLINNDHMSIFRKITDSYLVDTIDIDSLFRLHNVPKRINFLSIDTEGSEYEIISNLNFENYLVDFVTIEHNFTENQELTERLLMENNFVRIFRENSLFDGWYLNRNLISPLAKIIFDNKENR
jgi:FkbM family methyltransferase